MPSFRRRASVIDADRVDDRRRILASRRCGRALALAEEAEAEAAEAEAVAAAARAGPARSGCAGRPKRKAPTASERAAEARSRKPLTPTGRRRGRVDTETPTRGRTGQTTEVEHRRTPTTATKTSPRNRTSRARPQATSLATPAGS